MANKLVDVASAPALTNHGMAAMSTTKETNHAAPSSEQTSVPSWSFLSLNAEVNLRGGGCASSLLCDTAPTFDQNHEAYNSKNLSNGVEALYTETASKLDVTAGTEETFTISQRPSSPIWSGWAELENDPDIFTILLQEWGVPNLHVQEITDLADLITANPDDTLGLIFLSRYVPADTNSVGADTAARTPTETPSQPWFANQISKFSCGSVALMNILMNSKSIRLSETLSSFKSCTATFSAKDRGIALDENAKFREIHNSFSTKMDRMVVDVLLKEDARKFMQRQQSEARQLKLAEQQKTGGKSQKRKRGGITTKKRKKKSIANDEDDNGFHFVAYVPSYEAVWKMDGLQAQPACLGRIGVDQTWLNVAAADLMKKMEEAFSSGQECSLMSLSKTEVRMSSDAERDRTRKQEDWAPFIEHMLRMHAEKGDLQELLGL